VLRWILVVGLKKMSLHTSFGHESATERNLRLASQRARFSKLIGPVAVLAGLAVFALFLAQSGFFDFLNPLSPPNTEKLANPTLISGTHSQITGFDKNNQPFEITAQKGLQDKDTASLVHLETVAGVFHREAGKKIEVASDGAKYDSKTKALRLDGNVIFQEVGRYKATMSQADINVDDNSLSSQFPVHVDTSNGTVEADSMTVRDNGNRILFRGHVKAKLATGSTKGDVE
jgi:lipopolysaccharide export system protein LptC